MLIYTSPIGCLTVPIANWSLWIRRVVFWVFFANMCIEHLRSETYMRSTGPYYGCMRIYMNACGCEWMHIRYQVLWWYCTYCTYRTICKNCTYRSCFTYCTVHIVHTAHTVRTVRSVHTVHKVLLYILYRTVPYCAML